MKHKDCNYHSRKCINCLDYCPHEKKRQRGLVNLKIETFTTQRSVNLAVKEEDGRERRRREENYYLKLHNSIIDKTA